MFCPSWPLHYEQYSYVSGYKITKSLLDSPDLEIIQLTFPTSKAKSPKSSVNLKLYKWFKFLVKLKIELLSLNTSALRCILLFF